MRPQSIIRTAVVLVCAATVCRTEVRAQQPSEIATGKALFLNGNYAKCLESINQARQNGMDSPTHGALELRVLLETGKIPEALKRAMVLSRRAPFDPELSLAVVEALNANGQILLARQVTQQALQANAPPPLAGASVGAVAYGKLLLSAGTDAKEVLKQFLEPSKKADPTGRDAYMAIGQLALTNHDRDLAAENFRAGLKRFPGDSEFLLGMEEAGVSLPKDQQKADDGILTYLDLALRANPHSTDALLHKAMQLLGMKNFRDAKTTLEQVLEINPNHPEAWAQVAALALLEENTPLAEKFLTNARKYWRNNPKVPETIGLTLAAQYRFAEAIEHLREAYQLAPGSPSIQFELGSNLLRFGKLNEGWALIELAHQADPYNVAAYNLLTLRDKLKDYPVTEKNGVRLRMSPEDMAVFGARALDLAEKAKRTLTEKYKVTLSQPVMVEILPTQEDFAIRTFGLPGGESFLGVCFGPLITMTSPRGRLGRANWEAVLWHEMAHTVTLDATRHRIPRWLSEGISVYEEREVRPGWGQGMTAEFRERFLSGEMPDIIHLDESFAGPDILFGYYHASLVAEFIIQRFGIEAMRLLLTDLGAGRPLGKSLEAHTLALVELETSFKEYAKNRAAAYGPNLDWAPLADDEYVKYREDPAAWVSANPQRYASAMMLSSKLSEDKKWQPARDLLETIIAGEPNNREAYNPYWALSIACRNLGDSVAEQAALSRLLQIDSNASEAAARLLELSNALPATERLSIADQMLQTNPFHEQAYRTRITVSKETGAAKNLVEACVSLLALEPGDASRLHYELAMMLETSEPNKARREVLKALEENPRFEMALELLARLPPSS